MFAAWTNYPHDVDRRNSRTLTTSLAVVSFVTALNIVKHEHFPTGENARLMTRYSSKSRPQPVYRSRI